MAMATITARIDANDKTSFDEFCSNIGINISTAINIFVKKVLSEKRIPFELSRNEEKSEYESDDYRNKTGFWNPYNQKILEERINSIKNNTAKFEQHDLIEVDDE